MPTVDEILANAKRTLAKRSVVDDANAFAVSEEAARREAETLTPMGTMRRYGAPLVEGVKAAAIPAAFLGGPVGVAAGSMLALEGLEQAVKEPSLSNVGMTALSAFPFARMFKGGMRAGKQAAAQAETVVDRYMPNVSKMRSAAERRYGKRVETPPLVEPSTGVEQYVPNTPGSSSSGGRIMPGQVEPLTARILNSPVEQHMLNAPANTGREFGEPAFVLRGLDDIIDRHMPNAPGSTAGKFGEPALPIRGSDELIDPFMPNLPATPTLSQQIATQTVDRNARLRGTTADVPANPVAQQLERERRALEDEYAAFESGDTPAHLAELDREHAAMLSRAGQPPQRIPMGKTGNEYVTATGEKVQPYGPSTVPSPEETAAAPEFWDDIIERLFGTIGRQ